VTCVFFVSVGCDRKSLEMPFWSAISRLVTVLAVMALIAGAWIAPAKAGFMWDIEAVVTNGMPCCDPPEESRDCRDMTLCPFAAVCATPSLQGTAASAAVILPPLATTGVPLSGHDQRGDSLASSPLGHPPKT